MSLSLADKIFLTIGLADFGGALICIGVALHLAYTQADVMLSHFKNSPSILALAPLKQGGIWGKLLLIGGISGMVTFPGFYTKSGRLCAEDLSRFSAPLKRKLVLLQWCVIGLLLVMVSLAAVAKLGLV